MNSRLNLAMIFLLPAFLLSLALSGQSDQEKAKEQLQQLKNGVLLVRLKTNANSIEAYEQAGLEKEAEAARQKQYQENKEIILSFSQTFDFAPVYFFYSDASDAIRKGQFEGQVFDSKLKPVEIEKLEARPVFTGEFSQTPNTGIKGFVLMNQDMIPLKSPFPFYQRQYVFFSLITLSKAKVVERYNERLHGTYQLWFPEKS